jgi:holo-ACP synthase/triphosphoribosyl-dephospho-CoA synthase
MLKKYKSLENILRAREDRAKLRFEMAKNGMASLSLTLNIPGYPKHNKNLDNAFKQVLNDLRIYLQAYRIPLVENNHINRVDEAGSFFLIGLGKSSKSLEEIKQKTEEFEHHHMLDRLIDVDIFSAEGLPVSSEKVKACIICEDKTAVECMRNKTHDYKELRQFIFDKIDSYLAKNKRLFIQKKLVELSSRALLYEVSLSPKPGLVDFTSSGSHKDMNYYSFLNSSTALIPYWKEFAKSGLNYKGSLRNALPHIRQIGLRAEQSMFKATNSVNTQKGLIFLLGLSTFLTAYQSREFDQFQEEIFIKQLKKVCSNLVAEELEQNREAATTHGEITFKKFGKKGAGVRLEAQNGFPLIFNGALPYLESNLNENILSDKEQLELVLSRTLLLIITQNKDTNVLYRIGEKKAEDLKRSAQEVLDKQKTYVEFCQECIHNNISPGGSADMLGVALFFYFVKRELILA